jgi:3-deoxy-manno-octulosonate cytidylyltransferase (CMP-KDO synthetase)
MRIIGIIPAHLESKRLPRKALTDICGLPMVVHTYERARLSEMLDEVYVATDSTEIAEVIIKHGGKAVLTGKHNTGSDRVAEASRWICGDIIVNIQGDEPLLNPNHIDTILAPVMEERVLVSCGVTPYYRRGRPSDIKAVLDNNWNIMYCSREDIPSDTRTTNPRMWKMCFIVPFKYDFLQEYTSWDQTPLEKIESNEYIRILEHGVKIRGVPVKDAYISVDTPQDLEEVRRIMADDEIKELYMGE